MGLKISKVDNYLNLIQIEFGLDTLSGQSRFVLFLFKDQHQAFTEYKIYRKEDVTELPGRFLPNHFQGASTLPLQAGSLRASELGGAQAFGLTEAGQLAGVLKTFGMPEAEIRKVEEEVRISPASGNDLSRTVEVTKVEETYHKFEREVKVFEKDVIQIQNENIFVGSQIIRSVLEIEKSFDESFKAKSLIKQKSGEIFDAQNISDCESRSEDYQSQSINYSEARGVRKVTTGITGLWQPSVHSDVAF